MVRVVHRVTLVLKDSKDLRETEELKEILVLVERKELKELLDYKVHLVTKDKW